MEVHNGKNMEKIVSVIMATVLVLPLSFAFTATANTEEAATEPWDTDGDGCSYERTLPPYDSCGTAGDCFWYLKDTKLTVTGNGAMAKYEAATPAPWGTLITEAVIENGVEDIGTYAFVGCTALTSVTLPNTVKTIGARAFSGCTALQSIEIPASVETIGSRAFNGCSSLQSVSLTEGLEVIGERAFFGCAAFTDLTIPASVTSIGKCLQRVCIPYRPYHLRGSSEHWDCFIRQLHGADLHHPPRFRHRG